MNNSLLAVSYGSFGDLGEWNRWQQARLQESGSAQVPSSPLDPQFLSRYSYCGNNPMGCIDPSGHDTFFLGFSGILAPWGGAGGVGSVGIAFDLQGNVGFSLGEGFVGVAGISVSGGPAVGWSSANTIYDLRGPSINLAGGSVGAATLGMPIGVGFDSSVWRTGDGELAGGWIVSLPFPGPGTLAEFHGGVSVTQVVGTTWEEIGNALYKGYHDPYEPLGELPMWQRCLLGAAPGMP